MVAEDSGFEWSNAGPGETMISRISAGGLLRSGDIGGIDSTLSGVSEIRSRSVAILPIGMSFLMRIVGLSCQEMSIRYLLRRSY